ncbi:TRAP transporter substrate-binding protein DctP [Salibacterium aidingense]|uniref:TRAP transporter substrate-binding protein DctP n=1 Tax=Salibacterium aidingense TaxID=384933 RepID=UPI00047C1AC4|nr:TRAP transporter substrate-binding protein DctP [Salibacterium aidingense]
MKLIHRFNFLSLLLLITLLAACGDSTDQETTESNASEDESSNTDDEIVTLDAVSFLGKGDPLTATIEDWINSVENATEGRVEINWRGGADVIPIEEQFESMNSNVIDINFTYIGQYQSDLPISRALPLSQLKPWEERNSGFYDFMDEQHNEIGVKYIGRWLTGSPRLWLNEPVETVDDLNNRVIRSTPNYTRFFDELGISSSMIDPSEVYTALQTGQVEGFVYGGLTGPRKDGWTDSAKYVLDEPFWTQNCTILMNNDSWDNISSEDQEAIMEATAEYERDMVEYYESQFEEERQTLKENDVEFIEFPEEEEEKFLNTAYDVEWESLQSESSTELVEKARELATKEEG